MALFVLYQAIIWTSLVAGTLSAETETLCPINILTKSSTCRFGFPGTFTTWREITCNIFPLLDPARILIELSDFCSNVSTNSAQVSAKWRQRQNANSSFDVKNCSKVQASGGKDENKHVQVKAHLGKNDSLDVVISVKRPLEIRLLARASSGIANFYCQYSGKSSVQEGTSEEVKSTEETITKTTENTTTTVILKGGSTVILTASILASVVIVALLGLALRYAWKRKRSDSPHKDSAGPTVEDRGLRETTPDNTADAAAYDLLGRFRKPEGASADPTYGHLEPEEGNYSHVQRGPSKRPMVIMGDNLYGHLDTAGE